MTLTTKTLTMFVKILLPIMAVFLRPTISWAAAERTAPELLPATTLMYAEAPRPAELMQLITEHPLRTKLEGLEAYRALFKSKQMVQFQVALGFVQLQIGMKWQDALAALTEGGVYLAFDSKTQTVALLSRARDQAVLGKLRDAFIRLATSQNNTSSGAAFKRVEYRGLTAYEMGDLKFTTLGTWLVATNKGDLLRSVADNFLDGGGNGKSLSSNPGFQAAATARGQLSSQPTAWIYADIESIRTAMGPNGLYKKKTDNPVVEIMIGGLLETFQKTPHVTASLFVEPQRIALALSAPHDPTWVNETREYYFGPAGKGSAPPLLQPKDALATIGTYRDVASMWMRSADLFDDKIDAGFAQANSTLSTFFSGKDFGRDILASFRPEIQIVVARQQFQSDAPTPAIKLPSFAFVFRLKEPERMRGELRRTFQSFVGFFNVVGAMNGQPQLDLDIRKEGGDQIITANYLPEEEEKKSMQARIHFNFSPSAAFTDDLFIISSTRQFAQELVTVAKRSGPPAPAGGSITNTQFHIDFGSIRNILEDNRKQLVAQNMLSEGKDKETAERDIGLLLQGLGLLRDINAMLSIQGKTIELKAELNFERQ